VIRLAVRVAREQAEIALAQLLELAPSGVEEVDVDEQLVEYAVYGAPGELPDLGLLRAQVGEALVEVQSREIADDWEQRWRQFHRPVLISGRLCVHPPWEPASDCELAVRIDPGRAFGTGAHATTRLCLELLLDRVDHRGAAVDLGCGSGVLAITAAKLGHRPVLAFDNDQAAILATHANAAANSVTVHSRRLDLRRERVPPAPLVLANLLAPLLVQWASTLTAGAPTPDAVIAGGLLVDELDVVADAFAVAGFEEHKRRLLGEWGALELVRAQGRGGQSRRG
jgi:ribosomal protein L11 methyltransferase